MHIKCMDVSRKPAATTRMENGSNTSMSIDLHDRYVYTLTDDTISALFRVKVQTEHRLPVNDRRAR